VAQHGGMRCDDEEIAKVREKFTALSAFFDERSRRWWAAPESRAIEPTGDTVVSKATGIARATVRKGRQELEHGVEPGKRLRRPGGMTPVGAGSAWPSRGLGGAGGAGHARRSAVAVALDVQEQGDVGGRAQRAEVEGQPAVRSAFVARQALWDRCGGA
jgi:hypothetical protein